MPTHTLPKHTPEGEGATSGTADGGNATWSTLAREGRQRGGCLPPSQPFTPSRGTRSAPQPSPSPSLSPRLWWQKRARHSLG